MKTNNLMNNKRFQIIIGSLCVLAFLLIISISLYKLNNKVENLSSIAAMTKDNDPSQIQLSIENIQLELNKLMDELNVLNENNETEKQTDESRYANLLATITIMNQQIKELSFIIASKETEDSSDKKDAPTPTSTILPTPTPTPQAEQQATVELTPTPPSDKQAKNPTTTPSPTPSPAPAISNVITKGQNFKVIIYSDSINDLYGYQFNLYYDKSKVTYQGELTSLIDDISTIFYKDMSDHLLIGATMIGSKNGYSGENIPLCSMNFTAEEDFDLTLISIDGVNTVTSGKIYTENLSGWSFDVSTE